MSKNLEIQPDYKNLDNVQQFIKWLREWYDKGVEELTPGINHDLDVCLETIKANLNRTDLDFDINALHKEALELRNGMHLIVFRTIAEWKAMNNEV